MLIGGCSLALFGVVAQLVERLACTEEVAGSNPADSKLRKTYVCKSFLI